MAGPFYFAYVGGVTDPAFDLITTADVWGGSITVKGKTWGGTLNTSADIIDLGYSVNNMLRDDGLIVGNQYTISGKGIPVVNPSDGITPIEVEFIYNGSLQGVIEVAANASAIGTPILIKSDAGRNIVFLNSIAGLVIGRVYGISASGIPPATTFTYTGSSQITISQNCSTTSNHASITITSLEEKNVLKNIANTAGLIANQTYNVFGQGIPAGTTAEYLGGNSITISTDAKVTNTGVRVYINKGVTFSDGGPFDPAVHNVEDEFIFKIEVSQSEGDFAALKIEIPKPPVGVLNPSRKVWCFFSWDRGSGPEPMFHGRLVGTPEDTGAGTVSLLFVARPENYETIKAALADTLKVPPYWDEVWLAEKQDNPDTVLTARPQLWDIDRITLAVSVTNIISGEDGTINITEDQTLYENFDLNYTSTAKRRINVNATVGWPQTAEGTVDLTEMLCNAFSSVGSGMGFPVISSFTGDGLKSTWPAPNSGLGDGWSIDSSAAIIDATWSKTGQYAVQYQAKPPSSQTTQQNVSASPTISILSNPSVPTIGTQLVNPDVTYDVLFPLSVFAISFILRYDAVRNRTETVSFSLESDIQSVLVEPGAAETEQIDLSSNFISDPIDANGAIPILDLRRNTYFKTDRGQQSFQYLLMLAVSTLLKSARMVAVKISTDWNSLFDATCRKNIFLTDRRLFGGEATGKITEYSFIGDGDRGEFMANAILGCTIGNGNIVSPTDGTPVFVNTDYIDSGYQQETGAQISVIDSVLTYESFDDFVITDDDGLDLFNMTPENVVTSLQILGGFEEQKNAIDTAVDNNSKYGDPVTALSLTPTRVEMYLVPVTGGPFASEYSVIVSRLAVPKTIDLGASS